MTLVLAKMYYLLYLNLLLTYLHYSGKFYFKSLQYEQKGTNNWGTTNQREPGTRSNFASICSVQYSLLSVSKGLEQFITAIDFSANPVHSQAQKGV
jgi:hypothetical protein